MPLRAEYSSVKSKRCCAQESVSMSTEVGGGGGGGGGRRDTVFRA